MVLAAVFGGAFRPVNGNPTDCEVRTNDWTIPNTDQVIIDEICASLTDQGRCCGQSPAAGLHREK